MMRSARILAVWGRRRRSAGARPRTPPVRSKPAESADGIAATDDVSFHDVTRRGRRDRARQEQQASFPVSSPTILALFEDGKPQSIQQFYMVTHDSSARNPVAGAGVNGAQSAEDRAHRVFVLLFDEGSLGNESLMRVKKGAEQFIQEQIGPGDIGGVFVAGNMYRSRLTTDKNELIMAVRSARPTFDNRQSLLAPLREFPRIPERSRCGPHRVGRARSRRAAGRARVHRRARALRGDGPDARHADRRGREPDSAESRACTCVSRER